MINVFLDFWATNWDSRFVIGWSLTTFTVSFTLNTTHGPFSCRSVGSIPTWRTLSWTWKWPTLRSSNTFSLSLPTAGWWLRYSSYWWSSSSYLWSSLPERKASQGTMGFGRGTTCSSHGLLLGNVQKKKYEVDWTTITLPRERTNCTTYVLYAFTENEKR